MYVGCCTGSFFGFTNFWLKRKIGSRCPGEVFAGASVIFLIFLKFFFFFQLLQPKAVTAIGSK